MMPSDADFQRCFDTKCTCDDAWPYPWHMATCARERAYRETGVNYNSLGYWYANRRNTPERPQNRA